jgi:TPR repeat protein
MSHIGNMYYYGWGVQWNYAEAMKWYRKAADAGSGYGAYCVGYLYRHGEGVARDTAEADRWYRKANELGYEC